MREEILRQLHCPGGGQRLEPVGVAHSFDGEIDVGAARCGPGTLFLIVDGILDLLLDEPGHRTLAQQTNFWPGTAAVYERSWRSRSLTLLSGEPFGFDRELPLLLDFVGAPRAGLWLDLAASTALYGRALAGHVAPVGGEVVANDIALPMLRAARDRAHAEGRTNLSFVRCRAERLPFADGQLAGAVCGGSLNEFGAAGLVPALRELHRCLATGAPAVFMHLLANPRPLARRVQRLIALTAGIVFPTLEETNRLFTAAGFEIERQEHHGIVAFSRLSSKGSR